MGDGGIWPILGLPGADGCSVPYVSRVLLDLCILMPKRSAWNLTPACLQEGFWSWISGVTDNAVYPVMILTYLQELLPIALGGWQRMYGIFVAIICCGSCPSSG